MKTSESRINVWRYITLAMLLWTAVIGILSGLNIYQAKQQVLDFAEVQARSTLNKDLIYRRWNASYGGVYVPITEKSQPNPYLTVPNRDVTTTTRLELTLINPAYMTRQVYEMSEKQYDEHGHITSLNPIRPQNAPDAWEAQALKSFETGVKETSAVNAIDGIQYLRLMIPLVTEEGCLKCHAAQGYKVGDIRGGLSVSVPMTPYLTSYASSAWRIALGYGLLWLLGVASMFTWGRRIAAQVKAQMQAEAALRESEARFHSIYDAEPECVKILNPDCTLVAMNPAGLAMIEVESLETAKGQSVLPIVDEEFRDDFRRLTENVCQKGESGELEFKITGLKGTPRWLETHAVPLRDSQGKITGLLGVTRDITEHRQAEEALRQSEERFSTLVKGTVEGVLVHRNTKPLFVNPAYARILGYASPDEILSMDSVAPLIAPHDQARLLGYHAARMRGEPAPTLYEYDAICREGSVVTLQQLVTIISWDGEPAVLATIVDITERKQAQEALRHYADQLAAQNAELDAFAHTVAHDLKNPIGIIVGHAEFVEGDYATLSPEQVHDSLRRILRASNKLNTIVDELMLLAGVRQQEIVPAPLDMGNIVREAVDRLDVLARERNAQITLPAEMAWPVALGYAPWVEEVWVNYIGNACKYGAAPGLLPHITLGAGLTDPTNSSGQAMARFWVQDHGPGLSAEAQASLFIPFTRLAEARATGHGLGLSIVRRIVEKLGGHVGVESAPGQGSLFFFTLPLANVDG